MSAAPPPYQDVHARLERVLDAFGARRVFFASDLTRMPCDYRTVLDLFDDVLVGRPPDREWVLGRAVSEWLGWEQALPLHRTPTEEHL
jgi:predicted TIM-barrel fold metal-dependent hydrolase